MAYITVSRYTVSSCFDATMHLLNKKHGFGQSAVYHKKVLLQAMVVQDLDLWESYNEDKPFSLVGSMVGTYHFKDWWICPKFV